MADVLAPVICGERHIPIRQSCPLTGYMLFDSRTSCEEQGLALWQAEFERLNSKALARGLAAERSLHRSGLARCAAEDTGPRCEGEVFWRSSMEFLSAFAQQEAQ